MDGAGGHPSFSSAVESFWDLDDSPHNQHYQQQPQQQQILDAAALLRKVQAGGRVSIEDLQRTKDVVQHAWASGEEALAQEDIQVIQQLLAEVFRLMAATIAQGDSGFSRSISALVGIIQAVDATVSSHYETILSVWKGFLPVFLRHWERVCAADGQILLDILCRYSADGLKQLEESAAALNGTADPSQELQSLTKLLVFFITRLSAILAHIGTSIDDNGGGDTCTATLGIFCGYRGALEMFDPQHVAPQVQKLEELFLKAVNPSISSNSKAAGLGAAKCLALMSRLIDAESTEAPALRGVVAFASLMVQHTSIHHHIFPHECLRVAVAACIRYAAHAALQQSSSWSTTEQLLSLVRSFDAACSSWPRAHQQDCLAGIITHLAQDHFADSSSPHDAAAGLQLWFTLYFESRGPHDQEAILHLLYSYALTSNSNDGRARSMALLLAELLVVAEPSVSLKMAKSFLHAEQRAAPRRAHVVVHLLRYFPFEHFWAVPEMQGFLQALYQRALRQSSTTRRDGSFMEQLGYIFGLHNLVGSDGDEATSELVFSAISACLLSLVQELQGNSFDDTHLALLEHAVACLMSARIRTDDLVMHGLIDLGLQVLDAALTSPGCPSQVLQRLVLVMLDFTFWVCKNQLSITILQPVRSLWQSLFALIQNVDDCLLVSQIMKVLKMTAECIHSNFAGELKSFVPVEMLPVMQGYLQRKTVCSQTGATITSISKAAGIQRALSAKRPRQSAEHLTNFEQQQQLPLQKWSRSASSSDRKS